MLYFLDKEDINSTKYELLFEKTLSFIIELYGKKIKNTKKRDINNEINLSFPENISYDESIFLLPQYVEKILTDNENYKDLIDTKNNIFEYKDVVNSILLFEGYFKVDNKDKKYYINKFNKLLNINCALIKNNFAIYNTLLKTSSEIYTKNLSEISLIENENCNDAKKYIEKYKDIIKLN